VYLHSTPIPELFSKSRRDFSHGCIRAEKPEQLAEWVLRDQPPWSPERIAEAMKGTKTIQVNLDRPFPVLIVYATAVVRESGEVRFCEDIYGLDAQLSATLANRSSYASKEEASTQVSPGKFTNVGRVPHPRERNRKRDNIRHHHAQELRQHPAG
jgi:murein L,D-transpeptidase YcbB/YkuD